MALATEVAKDLSINLQQQQLPAPLQPPSAQHGMPSTDGEHGLAPAAVRAYEAAHRLALPSVTLAGPLELVLPSRQPVGLFLSHAADTGDVERIRLAPGVTVTLAHMRAVHLR